MKLDGASLAIGAGIGVVIVTAAVVIFVLQPGKVVTLGNGKAMAAIAANNGTHFFMSGLITQMSDDAMVINQTFGRPTFNDNPAVTVRLDGGAAFVSCAATGAPGENCQDSVSNRLGKERVSLCALTRMYNGEFYAGKIWADSACGPFDPDKNNG